MCAQLSQVKWNDRDDYDESAILNRTLSWEMRWLIWEFQQFFWDDEERKETILKNKISCKILTQLWTKLYPTQHILNLKLIWKWNFPKKRSFYKFCCFRWFNNLLIILKNFTQLETLREQQQMKLTQLTAKVMISKTVKLIFIVFRRTVACFYRDCRLS